MKKNQYKLTNCREHVGQIVKLGSIEENLHYIADQVDAVVNRVSAAIPSLKPAPGRQRLTEEGLRRHYTIGERGTSIKFTDFLGQITDKSVRVVSF